MYAGLNEKELERLSILGNRVQKTARRDIAQVVSIKFSNYDFCLFMLVVMNFVNYSSLLALIPPLYEQ